ncbi:MAG: DEAD/DEAH box helicase family protein [Bacteroidaceae bacterium]|nr:DEAD/DEAH box helicase family protein [Bacteroidaceae bacterium]
MKFKFKIQQYQTDAVEATVNVFAGQPSKTNAQYRRDIGKRKGKITFEEEYVGYRNSDVELQGHQLLANIQQQQVLGNIPKSSRLSMPDGLGACSLDIEMETGTGKTYVYIKTMFELNKRYGWSKFIVVVPSIALRPCGRDSKGRNTHQKDGSTYSKGGINSQAISVQKQSRRIYPQYNPPYQRPKSHHDRRTHSL